MISQLCRIIRMNNNVISIVNAILINGFALYLHVYFYKFSVVSFNTTNLQHRVSIEWLLSAGFFWRAFLWLFRHQIFHLLNKKQVCEFLHGLHIFLSFKCVKLNFSFSVSRNIMVTCYFFLIFFSSLSLLCDHRWSFISWTMACLCWTSCHTSSCRGACLLLPTRSHGTSMSTVL